MTPDIDPRPTPEQRAVELEVAAHIADANGDHLFAKEMRERAASLHELATRSK